MAEQAYAYVTLIPVAKGFQAGIAKELGGVDQLGAKAGSDFEKGFAKGADKLSSGIIAGFAAIAAGAGLLLKSSIGEASTLEESLNAVSVAYGKSSAAIVKLGETAASRLGVTQSEFNASAVRFSAFAERVVGAGGDVSGFVDDITTRASDFASVFNIDVAEALQVFQSGLSGEAEPLKRFGINLLDSEVNAFALANGIGAVGKVLTESEKVQARYGLLLQSTAKTSGDFANTSDGLANSQRILKAEFTDLQAAIGNALLPVMAGLVNQVKDNLLPIFERLGDWLDSPEGIQAIDDFGSAMGETVGFIVDVTNNLVTNFDAVQKIGGALLVAAVGWKAFRIATDQATIAQIKFNIAALKNPYVIAAVALVTLITAVTVFTKSMSNAEVEVAQVDENTRSLLAQQDDLNKKIERGGINSDAYRVKLKKVQRALNDVENATRESKNETIRFGRIKAAILPKFQSGSFAQSQFEFQEAEKALAEEEARRAEEEARRTSAGATGLSPATVRANLQTAIKETRDAYKAARADYNEIVADANKDFADRNNDILDRYTESVNTANKGFTDKSEDIVKRYSQAISKATDRRDTSMASALRDYNQGIVNTNRKFAEQQESIIQRSMDRLRDGFRSAVSVNVATIFDSDRIAGSVVGLVQTLREKLAGSKNLLENAARLTSAGFSQTFVEQVVNAGTELGNELANSILTATPETVSELQSLFGQIETTSETGMDALAQTIFDKTGLATTALQGLYDQTFIDLANSLTEQKAAYITQQGEIQAQFNSSIAEAEIARTEAMADANEALAESIAKAKIARDEALLDSQQTLDAALLKAAKNFTDDITAIQKVFQEKIGSMRSAVAGLASELNGVRAALSLAQRQTASAASSAAASIAARSTVNQPTFMATGGLVTSATNAIIGEAGPEVVIPLDRFESMMGMSQQGKAVNYYAAPNQSIDSEQDLFQAMRRAKVVAGW